MVARIPNDAGAATLRKMYAWVAADGDPAAKGSYKFAHHQVAADGTVGAANVRACQAGMAVLNGGRGGASIPDADRAGVHAHLARHMRDAGVDVPELASLPGAATQTPDHGPDSARLKMLRADALLAGEDPDDVIDPVTLAGVEARIDGIDEWVKTRTHQLELRQQMSELSEQLDEFRA
jgi:hypothetical protein